MSVRYGNRSCVPSRNFFIGERGKRRGFRFFTSCGTMSSGSAPPPPAAPRDPLWDAVRKKHPEVFDAPTSGDDFRSYRSRSVVGFSPSKHFVLLQLSDSTNFDREGSTVYSTYYVVEILVTTAQVANSGAETVEGSTHLGDRPAIPIKAKLREDFVEDERPITYRQEVNEWGRGGNYGYRSVARDPSVPQTLVAEGGGYSPDDGPFKRLRFIFSRGKASKLGAGGERDDGSGEEASTSPAEAQLRAAQRVVCDVYQQLLDTACPQVHVVAPRSGGKPLAQLVDEAAAMLQEAGLLHLQLFDVSSHSTVNKKFRDQRVHHAHATFAALVACYAPTLLRSVLPRLGTGPSEGALATSPHVYGFSSRSEETPTGYQWRVSAMDIRGGTFAHVCGLAAALMPDEYGGDKPSARLLPWANFVPDITLVASLAKQRSGRVACLKSYTPPSPQPRRHQELVRPVALPDDMADICEQLLAGPKPTATASTSGAIKPPH